MIQFDCKKQEIVLIEKEWNISRSPQQYVMSPVCPDVLRPSEMPLPTIEVWTLGMLTFPFYCFELFRQSECYLKVFRTRICLAWTLRRLTKAQTPDAMFIQFHALSLPLARAQTWWQAIIRLLQPEAVICRILSIRHCQGLHSAKQIIIFFCEAGLKLYLQGRISGERYIEHIRDLLLELWLSATLERLTCGDCPRRNFPMKWTISFTSNVISRVQRSVYVFCCLKVMVHDCHACESSRNGTMPHIACATSCG